MALCSDLIVAEDEAKIGYPPARVWGVPTTALWAHRIGPARAKRLLLTGDSICGRRGGGVGAGGRGGARRRARRALRGPAGAGRAAADQPARDAQAARSTRRSLAQGLLRPRRSAPSSTGSPATPQEGFGSSSAPPRPGFKQAVRERDEPFGDFGARPGEDEPDEGPGHQLADAVRARDDPQARRGGARGLAADDSELRAGSHSRYVSEHFVTSSPAGRHRGRSSPRSSGSPASTRSTSSSRPSRRPSTSRPSTSAWRRSRSLFFSPFATLAAAARQGRLRAHRRPPRPADGRDRDRLERRGAGRRRSSASRATSPAPPSRAAACQLLTNTGPLAGALDPSDCHPTEANPWLVQEFVDGETFCTYSTVHDGRITAHCAYGIPRQWKHSTGIQFERSTAPRRSRSPRRSPRDCDYTGQVSFDFIASPDGPTLVECNPRATDGVLLMGSEQLATGISRPRRRDEHGPRRREIQLDLAVFGGMFADGLERRRRPSTTCSRSAAPTAAGTTCCRTSTRSSSLAHYERLEHASHEPLFVAMAGDISWDGEPIAGMSDADAKLLGELRADGGERRQPAITGRVDARGRRREVERARSRPATKPWWISSLDRVEDRDRRCGDERPAAERRGQRPDPERGQQRVLGEVGDDPGERRQVRADLLLGREVEDQAHQRQRRRRTAGRRLKGPGGPRTGWCPAPARAGRR